MWTHVYINGFWYVPFCTVPSNHGG
jgi:hypothetical protein